MGSSCILLKLYQYNEIWTDVIMTTRSLDITAIRDIKIDTKCPFTSIPVLKFGTFNTKVLQMEQKDCSNGRSNQEYLSFPRR